MEKFFTSETLGVLAIGLTIVGIVKLIYYYKAFNVSILRYLEPSEVIILFADNISIAICVIFLLLAPYAYSMLPYIQNNITNDSSFIERLIENWHVMSNHFIYQSIIAVLVILLTFSRKMITNYERLTYFILSIVIIFVLPVTTLEVGYWAKTQIKPSIIISISLVLNFLIIIILATHNEIKKVRDYEYFACTYVEFEDGIIHPSNTHYIGKVKGFIFFYHPVDKRSFAYSTNKLRSINYKPYIKKTQIVN